MKEKIIIIDTDLKAYYAKRAAEYDQIYQKTQRKSELSDLQQKLKVYFDQARVLEVACGTGYWTQFYAAAASSVDAVDVNSEVLTIAENRQIDANIQWLLADFMQLNPLVSPKYDAAFIGFYLSHLLKIDRISFFQQLHRFLQPGAKVLMIDNCFVKGESTPINRIDDDRNQYQMRTLNSGEQFEIVKNFPSQTELLTLMAEFNIKAEYQAGRYFWQLSYQLAEG